MFETDLNLLKIAWCVWCKANTRAIIHFFFYFEYPFNKNGVRILNHSL